MLLTKITLKDFGVYRGENEFDFTVEEDKPIILIGEQTEPARPLCLIL